MNYGMFSATVKETLNRGTSSKMTTPLKTPLKITNPAGPNVTILLPGNCSASCSFCFWNRDLRLGLEKTRYLYFLTEALCSLPKDIFHVLSISGGEPTESPMLQPVLDLLKQLTLKDQIYFDRIVLTTNAAQLKKVSSQNSMISHINVSRHAPTYAENKEIFKTKAFPRDTQLKEDIFRFGENGISTTINCVVPPDVTVDFCEKMIAYAISLGAKAVSFRKHASNVDPTEAETEFKTRYPVVAESACTVCRGVIQKYSDDFELRWKGSVHEPSLMTGGLYEVIIHPDGEIYLDWGRKHKISFPSGRTVASDAFDAMKRDAMERVSKVSPPVMLMEPQQDLSATTETGDPASLLLSGEDLAVLLGRVTGWAERADAFSPSRLIWAEREERPAGSSGRSGSSGC